MNRERASGRSLIWRVMAVQLMTTAMIFVIAAAILASRLQRQAEGEMDNRLQAVALDLFAGLSFETDGTPALNRLPYRSEFEERLSGWYWQIRRNNETIARSGSLLLQDLPRGSVDRGTATGTDGMLLRVVSLARELQDSSEVLVQVSAPQDVIDQSVAGEVRLLAIGLLLLLLVLLCATAWLLSRGLSPLRQIQGDLANMISGERKVLGPTGYRELDGMVTLINSLVEQGRAQVASNRDAANKLAHALKTPLALIAARTHESGSSPDPEIRSSIETMRAHIEHNLKRTRLAGARRGMADRISVDPVVSDLMFAFAHSHRDRNISQKVDIATGATFIGDKDDLVELLGNLLDNAHRFAATLVSVKAAMDAQGLSIRVCDDGLGFDNPDLSAALKAPQTQPPRGLGLEIARDIVNAYNGRLTFEAGRSGGLTVEVRFPEASAQQGQTQLP